MRIRIKVSRRQQKRLHWMVTCFEDRKVVRVFLTTKAKAMGVAKKIKAAATASALASALRAGIGGAK